MNYTNEQARASRMNYKEFIKLPYGQAVDEFLMTDHPAAALMEDGSYRNLKAQYLWTGKIYRYQALEVIALIEQFEDEIEQN